MATCFAVEKLQVQLRPLAFDDAGLRAELQRRIDQGEATFFAVALVNGRGARVMVQGQARTLDGAMADENALFELGSITKPLTATLVARLAERGVLTLDDPLSRWLPELPATGSGAITLRQLISHTSGLPRLPKDFRFLFQMLSHPKDPYASYTTADLLASVGKLSAIKRPAPADYSNLGYALLGVVAERAGGRPFHELLVSEVLRPAGMESATLEVTSRLVTPYDESGRKTVPWTLGAFSAAGGVRASIRDLLALLQALVSVRAPFAVGDFFPLARFEESNMAVCTGWVRKVGYGDSIIWHNGETGGFHSWIGFSPKRGVGAVVLVNRARNMDALGFHLVNAAFPIEEEGPPRRDSRAWFIMIVSALVMLTLASLLWAGRSPRWLCIPRCRISTLISMFGTCGWLLFILGLPGWDSWPAITRPLLGGASFLVAVGVVLQSMKLPLKLEDMPQWRSCFWPMIGAILSWSLSVWIWL